VNRVVNITKRVQTSKGFRYCPVVQTKNHRISTDMVFVNGQPERHPEGAFYIEWYEGKKRFRKSVGNNAAAADAQRHNKEAQLNAVNHGITIVPEKNKNGHPLAAAVTEYLDEIKLTKKPRTHRSYSVALSYFLESCNRPNLEDIERLGLLKFIAFLRDEKELAGQTVYNKFNVVMVFLAARGIRGLLRRNDRPNFTEEEVEIYEQEDLDKLFAACDEEEKRWYEFFLMTGMRDQEVRYCCWSDVNFNASTIRVSHKLDWGWTPKTYKERTIPIPTSLVTSLEAWKAKATCTLVFPTRTGQPKFDFLFRLKKITELAKLDPDIFWLHKFRATFATWHLQNGVDLRTVMEWMGHKNMKSTLRYLKPSRSQKTLARVNDTFSAFAS
jgi:integrase/recombinase XerD